MYAVYITRLDNNLSPLNNCLVIIMNTKVEVQLDIKFYP